MGQAGLHLLHQAVAHRHKAHCLISSSDADGMTDLTQDASTAVLHTCYSRKKNANF